LLFGFTVGLMAVATGSANFFYLGLNGFHGARFGDLSECVAFLS
jgi:hypothetical protein